ncbi:hypothetical protein FDECE_7527 [Fusarium decemcellulare]|nr:hypothetical protein FDECE_7527 [Fusarium decemcellulare]
MDGNTPHFQRGNLAVGVTVSATSNLNFPPPSLALPSRPHRPLGPVHDPPPPTRRRRRWDLITSPDTRSQPPTDSSRNTRPSPNAKNAGTSTPHDDANATRSTGSVANSHTRENATRHNAQTAEDRTRRTTISAWLALNESTIPSDASQRTRRTWPDRQGKLAASVQPYLPGRKIRTDRPGDDICTDRRVPREDAVSGETAPSHADLTP